MVKRLALQWDWAPASLSSGNFPSHLCPHDCKVSISYDFSLWLQECEAEPRGASDCKGQEMVRLVQVVNSHSLQLWLRARQALLGGSQVIGHYLLLLGTHGYMVADDDRTESCSLE